MSAQTSNEKRHHYERWSNEMALLFVLGHAVGPQCQQISAHIFCNKMKAPGIDEEWLHLLVLATLVQHVLWEGLVEFHLLKRYGPNSIP